MMHRGFTVIEILVVGLIVALACLLGVVSISQQAGSTVLHSAGLSLLQVSRYGRLMAVENHRPCRLCMDLDNRQYWLSDYKQTTAAKTDAPERLESVNGRQDDAVKGIVNRYLQKRQLPERVRFVRVGVVEKADVNRGVATIVFNADGTAGAGIIQIAVGDEAQTIVIHPCTARAELHGGLINTMPVEVIDLAPASTGSFTPK
jgi:Tfp pilus assembly protein FimT